MLILNRSLERPKFNLFVATALLILCLPIEIQSAERIGTVEAAKYVGKRATVCGQVASVNYAENSEGRPTFLNLDKGYPNQNFTVVIWGENRDKFSPPPEMKYAGVAICVTGTIRMSKNVAEIVVSDPSQIRRDDKQ
jgi:DNA/RNA endonuclease YhcR with UshA esterase domain